MPHIINILKENKVEGVQNDYKRNLKSLISENIKDIHFNRPSDRTKPMQIFFNKYQSPNFIRSSKIKFT